MKARKLTRTDDWSNREEIHKPEACEHRQESANVRGENTRSNAVTLGSN